MFDAIFRGVFDADWMAVIRLSDFLICLAAALILGLIIAGCSMYRTRSSQSFILTLALLPSVVCVVIMLVNGNIGAGVAVAGAFSLIRFRSAAGTAREICSLFLAMGAGLLCGMGYIGFAAIFTLILCGMFLLYSRLGFGTDKRRAACRTLRITIPEDLNYTTVFDDLFAAYLSSYELLHVKTANMGSLYRLTYEVVLKDSSKEKDLLDQLRCRNGNLEISVSKTAVQDSEM